MELYSCGKCGGEHPTNVCSTTLSQQAEAQHERDDWHRAALVAGDYAAGWHREVKALRAEVRALTQRLEEARSGRAECIDDDGTPFASARAWRSAHAAALARAEALERALTDAHAALDRDRTGLAAALNKIRAEVGGRYWLGPEGGWANYSWEEHTADTLRKEIGWAFEAIAKIAADALTASGTIAIQGCRAISDARALAGPSAETGGAPIGHDLSTQGTGPCLCDHAENPRKAHAADCPAKKPAAPGCPRCRPGLKAGQVCGSCGRKSLAAPPSGAPTKGDEP